MTTRQKEIIIGSILGDGGIYSSNSPRAHYYVKQSKRYAEYVFWLYGELGNLCPSGVKTRKDNEQHYFYSTPSKELMELRKQFYEKEKRVPQNIKNLLTSPLSLAVWFMDDGTLDYREKDHCAFHLCTNCFTREDTKRLIEALQDNFGVVSSLHYTLCRGKRHCRIYIGAKGRDRFIELITPYILDCFKYKLPRYRLDPQRLVAS